MIPLLILLDEKTNILISSKKSQNNKKRQKTKEAYFYEKIQWTCKIIISLSLLCFEFLSGVETYIFQWPTN